jgi:hypothetical protein
LSGEQAQASKFVVYRPETSFTDHGYWRVAVDPLPAVMQRQKVPAGYTYVPPVSVIRLRAL